MGKTGICGFEENNFRISQYETKLHIIKIERMILSKKWKHTWDFSWERHVNVPILACIGLWWLSSSVSNSCYTSFFCFPTLKYFYFGKNCSMDLEEILIRFTNEREVLESQGYTSFFPYKQSSLYLFDKMCFEKHFFPRATLAFSVLSVFSCLYHQIRHSRCQNRKLLFLPMYP